MKKLLLLTTFIVCTGFAQESKLPRPRVAITTFSGEKNVDVQPGQRLLPVILIHGFTGDKHSMEYLAQLITQKFPGTEIKFVDMSYSLYGPIDNQAEWVEYELLKDPTLQYGCNIIGYSQGGLIARAIMQRGNLDVRSYFGLGTPQGGVSHLTGPVQQEIMKIVSNVKDSIGAPHEVHLACKLLEEFLKSGQGDHLLHKILYHYPADEYLSIADYWYESMEHNRYLKIAYLAELNNQKQHDNYQQYQDSVKKLNYFVSVMPEQEEIIAPKESCLFGIYQEGQHVGIVPVQNSDIYNNLGLSYLDQQGKLVLASFNGGHSSMVDNPQNFELNIAPYLTVATAQEIELMTQAEKIDTTNNTIEETCCSCLQIFCRCKEIGQECTA